MTVRDAAVDFTPGRCGDPRVHVGHRWADGRWPSEVVHCPGVRQGGSQRVDFRTAGCPYVVVVELDGTQRFTAVRAEFVLWLFNLTGGGV